MKNFFVYDPINQEVDFFATEEEACNAAEKILEVMNDFDSQNIDELVYGRVLGYPKCINGRTEAEEEKNQGFDYIMEFANKGGRVMLLRAVD